MNDLGSIVPKLISHRCGIADAESTFGRRESTLCDQASERDVAVG